jgi:DNA repair photolyase
MTSINPEKLFVNKKSVGTFLHKQIKKAHPNIEEEVITTNTRLGNEKYNLISIDPKKRGLQKRKFLGLLHRDSLWKLDPNGRSTDFLPSNMIGYGCRFNCSYCYVDRRDPATFPKLYDDALDIIGLIKHTMLNIKDSEELFYKVTNKKVERKRDPKHSNYITFDLGCDSDCVLDNQITLNDEYPGHIIDIINNVADIPEAMISFATKSASIDNFIKYVKKPEMTRIRLSLMPEQHRSILEMNTSKIEDRIQAINKLVDAGFEVHINLSPIVVTANFAAEYADLLKLINDSLSDNAKKQMAYEIIFLTHSESLFGKTPEYAPKAHDMMVNGPIKLVPKWNKPNVLSYDKASKEQLKIIMNSLIEEFTPYSRIRYMF